MKIYQVTRKLQVTVPKNLAEKVGIKPGDSVVFAESDDTILMRKVSGSIEEPNELKVSIEEFAKDVAKLKPLIHEAESALVENLSRHVSSKRH